MGSKTSTQPRSGSIVGIITWLVLLLLLPIMLLSLSIVIQAVRQPNRLPMIFGYKALVLLPDENTNDRALGLIRLVEPTTLTIDDWVAYQENNTFFVEQIAEIQLQTKGFTLRTKAGQTDSQTLIDVNQLEGILIRRIPRLGSLALFLQSPLGLMLFLLLPCLLLLLFDNKPHKRKQLSTDAASPVREITCTATNPDHT